MAVVPSPCIRVTIEQSLKHDVAKVSECCYLWRMKINTRKIKDMIVSTTHKASPVTPIDY